VCLRSNRGCFGRGLSLGFVGFRGLVPLEHPLLGVHPLLEVHPLLGLGDGWKICERRVKRGAWEHKNMMYGNLFKCTVQVV
jgi:hypothetical protein